MLESVVMAGVENKKLKNEITPKALAHREKAARPYWDGSGLR